MIKQQPSDADESNKNANRIYFPELDGLRFFAFLLVLIHHHNIVENVPLLSALDKHGWIGVDLFFVLSAFLFTKLLIAEHAKSGTISLFKFYTRRAFRIWPIYFLTVIASVLYYLYCEQEPMIYYTTVRLAGLVTFTDNLMAITRGYTPFPFIAHLWTISFEEQFYVLIPFIISFLIKASHQTRIKMFFAVLLLFNLVRLVMIYFEVPHPAIWVLPVTHFESILLGIVIGFGGMDKLFQKYHPLFPALLAVVFFVLITLLPELDHFTGLLTLTYTLIGLATAFVLLSVQRSDVLKKFLSLKPLVFFGKRSYGLYVYHFFGMKSSAYLFSTIPLLPDDRLSSFLMVFGITAAISILSYKYIEKPFLKMKQRFEVIVTRPV